MCSFRKLIYLSFYFWNINFSFCLNLNLYKNELDEIEKKFILNNINSNIKKLNSEISTKQKIAKKPSYDIEFLKVSNAIITIYNDVTNNNVQESKKKFINIYGALKKINFNFSKNDTDNCSSNQFLILRYLLFNAIKKEEINAKNFFNDYIFFLNGLKLKKIIGDYTYRNAVEYIVKSIFNKMPYDDIKKTNILNEYSKTFTKVSSPECSYYFNQFLNNLFLYIFDTETKSYKKIDNDSKMQIGDILYKFPFDKYKKYKNYTSLLFCLLSNDLNVVYDRKEDSFLLKSINSSNEMCTEEIKNTKGLNEYKKKIASLPVKNIENILNNNVEVLKDLEKFFYYNETVQPLTAYYEYQKKIHEEFSEIAKGNFNISYEFKNDIKQLELCFAYAYNHCKKYPSCYEDLVKDYNYLKNKKIVIKKSLNSYVDSSYSDILFNLSNEKKIDTTGITGDVNGIFASSMDYNNHKSCLNKIESFKKDITNTKKEVEELRKNYKSLGLEKDLEVDLKRYDEEFFNNLSKKDFDTITKKAIESYKTKIKSNLEDLKKDLKSKIKKINEIIANNNEIKEKVNIDISKYSDVFIDSLNFDNIKNIKEEINNLYYDIIKEEKKKEEIKKEEVKKEIKKGKKGDNKEGEKEEIKKEDKTGKKEKEKKIEKEKDEHKKEERKDGLKKEDPKKENKEKTKEAKPKKIEKNEERPKPEEKGKEDVKKKEEPKIENKEEEIKKEEENKEDEKPNEENIEKEEEKEEKKEENNDDDEEEENYEEGEGDNEEGEENYEEGEGDNEEGEENNNEGEGKPKPEKKKENDKIKDKKKTGIINGKGKNNDNSTTPKPPCSCKKEGGSCKKQ